MGPSTTEQTVSLSGKVSRTGDRLVVEYRLTNQRAWPIYVLDRLVNYNDQGPFLDPELAYVCWEEPRTLRLVRATLLLPLDRSVYTRDLPYARPVPPGEAVEGRIVLRVPVVEYNPLYPPAKEFRDVSCDTVRLLIGWTEQREGVVIQEREVGGEPALTVSGPPRGPYQQLAEGKWPCPVPVRVYRDKFDRRMPLQ
jgi:hypothetical protein